MHEIHELAPHARYAARKRQADAWGNPGFVGAVKVSVVSPALTQRRG